MVTEHFGHCESFSIFETENNKIVKTFPVKSYPGVNWNNFENEIEKKYREEIKNINVDSMNEPLRPSLCAIV